jgi:hypothetical protein
MAAQKTAQKHGVTKRRRTTPAKVHRHEEVTLVADYESPWKDNERAEIAVIEADRWHPTIVDFKAVANTPNLAGPTPIIDVVTIGTLGELAGAVENAKDASGKEVERPGRCVPRLNLISHGLPGLVSTSGTVAANGDCDLGRGDRSASAKGLDERTLEWLNTDPAGRIYRDKVRKKPRCVRGEAHGRGIDLSSDEAIRMKCRPLTPRTTPSDSARHEPTSPAGGTRIRDFKFNPDYQVDKILFRRLLGTVTNAPSIAAGSTMRARTAAAGSRRPTTPPPPRCCAPFWASALRGTSRRS